MATSLHQKSASLDGPLLQTLLLNNQNQNQHELTGDNDVLAPESVALELLSSHKSELGTALQQTEPLDGPLLLGLLLTNENNANAANGGNANNDVLATETIALELIPQHTPKVRTSSHREPEASDGPLLLGLLLNNQNNNNPNSGNNDVIAPQSVALELVPLHNPELGKGLCQMSDDLDDPLLLTLLLTN